MTSPVAIERLLLAALAAFMLSVPWSIPALINSFWVSVIAEILIWSLFAASVNLLFGYVGLLSFGQALYFGFGMYGVAIGVSDLGLSFWPGPPVWHRRRTRGARTRVAGRRRQRRAAGVPGRGDVNRASEMTTARRSGET